MLLRSIPAERFDLKHWERSFPCGTVSCAIGHAYRDRWFMERGFRASEESFGSGPEPEYVGYQGWKAIGRFFDLSLDEQEWLFSVTAYPKEERCDPVAVARRIEEFVARRYGG